MSLADAERAAGVLCQGLQRPGGIGDGRRSAVRHHDRHRWGNVRRLRDRPAEVEDQHADDEPADIVPVSCWLNEFQIVNSSSVAVTVWIADKQSTPIYLIPPTVLNPSGMVSGEFALGRAMRGGVTWGASGPGSHGYATGKLA